MRDQAVKLVLFLLLGLVAPAAFARPHKKADKADRVDARKTSSAVHPAAKGRESAASRSRGHGKTAATKRTTREASEPPISASPQQVDPPLPEIHVKHDRRHRSNPPASSPPDDPGKTIEPVSPQKASSADFLAVPAAVAVTLPSPGEAPEPPKVRKARLPKLIFPVVSVPPDPVPVLMPALYTRRGRLIVPRALKGSHEILLHQNEMADREGLLRVQDDEDLERMRGARTLVAIPVSSGLAIDERLPVNRRYCRPWTAKFLAAIGRAHYARFHTPLQVNSAVRTVEVQQRLLQTNGNAAPAEGSTASPHLTGQAVDVAKRGLSMAEIAWLRGYLLPLVQQGKVDVEEEFQQSCFHISVYKQYAPQLAPKQAAPRHALPRQRATAQVLAMALP